VYTRLTALENLELFAAMYEGTTAEPRALLAHLGLSEVAEVRVERFSKGMRTRLDLCRALLPDPELLFLDEPTSALDPSLSRHVRRLIRRRAESGGGVLLTTHDMHLADEVCHRVALLVDGRIVAFDTPRSLRLAGRRPPVRLEVREREELRVRECEISDLAEDEELRALLRSGRVETVHTREPSLEDVFLTLTGRELR
jgi:fluoroquinolone transport system ATP-binding protein